MTRIAAAILAGGQGTRLGGVNKALLEIGGQPMLRRVLAALRGADPVLLCAGGNHFPADIGISASHCLPDLVSDYAGPLAGVAAAIDLLARANPPPLLLTVAVDTPFFPPDFALRAIEMLGDCDGVIATFDGQDYPTNALWRFSAIAGLPDAVRHGTAPRSLKRLAAEMNVTRLDYAGILMDDPFANANTAADLQALEARWRGASRP